MPPEIARDAPTAWASLREIGGMEPGGRDADLEDALRRLLNPIAPNLDSALLNATTDDLVRALFEVISPFAAMFRDIIAFFRAAGANQGREQWSVRIDDEHLDLKDFQSFLQGLDSIEAVLDLPALDFRGAWLLNENARAVLPEEDVLGFLPPGSRPPTGDADIDEWLLAYGRGEYRPYPSMLRPGAVPPDLSDVAGVLWVAVERIRSLWGDRDRMMQDYRAYDGDRRRLLPSFQDDALDPGTIAQNETDFWLGSSTVHLARALRAPEPVRRAFADRIAAAYAGYGRRLVATSTDISLAERILQLPVWRRRHELYAVWIATQIVGALPDHTVEIHHEDGKIVFAFAETVVATIETAQPILRLFAERRVPLKDPIGEGRTGNVQPDYSLWSGADDFERCRLVVEVKHYKTAARRKFSEVLVDYARAHPAARIALVNHGPVADMLEGVDARLAARCIQFGDLTASNAARRSAFADLIQEVVGPPRPEGVEGNTAVLIDVSASMSDILRRRAFTTWIESPDVQSAALIALADSKIRQRCAPPEALVLIRSATLGSATDLAGPIEEMLQEFARVVVATDDGGFQDLAPFGQRAQRVSADDGLVVAIVGR